MAAPHPVEPPASGATPSGRWILLVEDDRELRGALADLLRIEGGYAVSEAENGLDALLLLRSASPGPDAVLLDLDLPVMDGLELRGHLAADPALACLPVLILSSREPDRLGAEVALQKPCRPEALLAALARILAPRPPLSPAR